MEAAVELIAHLKEQVDLLAHTKTNSEQIVGEATSLNPVQNQLPHATNTISQQKQLEKRVSLEAFQELDAYAIGLAADFEQLQAYCRIVEGQNNVSHVELKTAAADGNCLIDEQVP